MFKYKMNPWKSDGSKSWVIMVAIAATVNVKGTYEYYAASTKDTNDGSEN